MSNTDNQTILVGSFLDLMKYANEEYEKLLEVGMDLRTPGKVEEATWDNIKAVVGMPNEEKEGVWISDYWIEFAFGYIRGKLCREEAITRIINWREDFTD